MHVFVFCCFLFFNNKPEKCVLALISCIQFQRCSAIKKNTHTIELSTEQNCIDLRNIYRLFRMHGFSVRQRDTRLIALNYFYIILVVIVCMFRLTWRCHLRSEGLLQSEAIEFKCKSHTIRSQSIWIPNHFNPWTQWIYQFLVLFRLCLRSLLNLWIELSSISIIRKSTD